MGERFYVGARVAVEAFGVRLRDDFAKILIASEITREQAHVMGLLLGAQFVDRGELLLVNEIDFAAEQGLNPVLLGLLEKAGKSVEHAVVGDRERLHPELRGTRAELIRPRATIQQTVVSVDVEVDEFAVFFGHEAVILATSR